MTLGGTCPDVYYVLTYAQFQLRQAKPRDPTFPAKLLNSNDLYPDVRSRLQAVNDTGYFVAIAGNGTTRADDSSRL